MPLSVAERILGAIAASVLGLVLALVLAVIYPRAAHAQKFDCHDLAMVGGAAVDFRDAGAQLEKTVRIARARNADRTQAELAVIEREVRRAFESKATRREAIAELYKRCRKFGGDMGRAS